MRIFISPTPSFFKTKIVIEGEGGGGVEKWSVGREAHKLNRAISGDQQ